jgi:hypothetical protein
MTYKEIFEKLGISDYADRIFNSNSRGELFHLDDYALILSCFDDVSWFRPWLDDVVNHAENTWIRPESVFQHIPRLIEETLGNS